MVNKTGLFLDSSFLIAFYNSDDSQHRKAIQITSKLKQQKYNHFLDSLVILETLTVIKQKSHLILARVTKDLFNPQIYSKIDDNFDLKENHLAIDIFKENPKISLADAWIINLCQENNFTLLTFDQQLKKLCSKYRVKVF